MCFWGFVKKWSPTATSPQIPKILHYKSRFVLKTRINPGVSATKIRSQIGNSPWHGGFKFCVKNLTGSGIMAISVHVQQKIG